MKYLPRIYAKYLNRDLVNLKSTRDIIENNKSIVKDCYFDNNGVYLKLFKSTELNIIANSNRYDYYIKYGNYLVIDQGRIRSYTPEEFNLCYYSEGS